jgi:Kef-type K+ transport system membrane component KefB
MATGPRLIYERLTIFLTLGVVSYSFRKRFHQSTLVGEILIGIVIGQSFLGSLGTFQVDPAYTNTSAALSGISLLFLIGLMTFGGNGSSFLMSFFIGATLTAAGTAIAASALLELGLMREETFRTVLGASVVDEILVLLVLSIVVYIAPDVVDPLSVALLMAKAVALILLGILIGVLLLSPLVVRLQVKGLGLGINRGVLIIAMAGAIP